MRGSLPKKTVRQNSFTKQSLKIEIVLNSDVK